MIRWLRRFRHRWTGADTFLWHGEEWIRFNRFLLEKYRRRG